MTIEAMLKAIVDLQAQWPFTNANAAQYGVSFKLLRDENLYEASAFNVRDRFGNTCAKGRGDSMQAAIEDLTRDVERTLDKRARACFKAMEDDVKESQKELALLDSFRAATATESKD